MEFLKKLIANPTVKEVLRVLLAALAGYLGAGCTAAQHRALTVADCKARVLAPYVGEAAADVARSIDGRSFDPVAYLQAQGMTMQEILEVAKAYSACTPAAAPEPAPEPEYTPPNKV